MVAANEAKIMEDIKKGEDANHQFRGKSCTSGASNTSCTSITSTSHSSPTNWFFLFSFPINYIKKALNKKCFP
jgi:hypothetical protein